LVVLDAIADDDEAMEFQKSFFNGIEGKDKREDTLNRKDMVSFAKKLSKNIAFTASIAGCKGRFAEDKFQRKINIHAEHYEEQMQASSLLQDVIRLENE
jgi:hypothetical protein